MSTSVRNHGSLEVISGQGSLQASMLQTGEGPRGPYLLLISWCRTEKGTGLRETGQSWGRDCVVCHPSPLLLMSTEWSTLILSWMSCLFFLSPDASVS